MTFLNFLNSSNIFGLQAKFGLILLFDRFLISGNDRRSIGVKRVQAAREPIERTVATPWKSRTSNVAASPG